jgi:hypothetical protein
LGISRASPVAVRHENDEFAAAAKKTDNLLRYIHLLKIISPKVVVLDDSNAGSNWN